jgi:hypothetical protein
MDMVNYHQVPADIEALIVSAKASIDQLTSANAEEIFSEHHFERDEQRIYMQFDASMDNVEDDPEDLMPAVAWASLLAATAIVALARRR